MNNENCGYVLCMYCGWAIKEVEAACELVRYLVCRFGNITYILSRGYKHMFRATQWRRKLLKVRGAT